MLNVYKYYEEPDNLLLYGEIYDKLRLIDLNAAANWLPQSKEKLEPVVHIIEQIPELAYRYARNVMRERWPAAELVISRSDKIAAFYARDVIRGRWPEAEASIAKDPLISMAYAKGILAKDSEWTSQEGHEHGRWPEAEPYILADRYAAVRYATNVIKGRWPELEPLIITDPYSILLYATEALDERWPEAESNIKGTNYWIPYAKHFRITE